MRVAKRRTDDETIDVDERRQPNQRRTAMAKASEMSAFQLFLLAGEYKLPGGRRIATRYARCEHLLASLEFCDEKEAELRREELRRLEPHWGPGVYKEQAVEAYYAAHPEERPAPAGLSPDEIPW